MKKKILTVSLALALIAIVVSGSLAYFTAQDQVTNTFTIGSVLIDIWENNTPTDSDVMEFDTPLVPVVNTTDVTADDGFADKVVKVENTGVSSAYVRTHIAVPTALIGYLELKLDLSAWTYVGTTTATEEGVDYTVFTYDYNSALAADAFTEDLLLGAYLKADVDLKDNPATPSADLEICKKEADGTLWVYGSPWCGKEGWNRNTSAPLGGLCFLERAAENRIRRISPTEGVSRIFSQLLRPSTLEGIDATLMMANDVLTRTHVWLLGCNISKEATARWIWEL